MPGPFWSLPHPVLAVWLSSVLFYQTSLLLLLQNVTPKPWPQSLATLRTYIYVFIEWCLSWGLPRLGKHH